MSKKKIALYVFIMTFLAPLVYFSFVSDEDYDDEPVVFAPNQKMGTDTPQVKTPVVTKSDTGTVRIVQAVRYEDAYAAAAIIKRAMDQAEAEDFVSSRMSVRVLRAENDYYALQEKIAKSKANIKKFNSGDLVEDNKVNGMYPNSNEYPKLSQISEDGKRVSSKKNQTLSLAGIAANGVISVKIGDSEFTGVRVKHVIAQKYLVESVNMDLGCASLKNLTLNKPTTICFQG
ncbi:hypothetical protein [Shewanella sp. MBTL60-007]|uniref:hypothetical protein n=1 Tax=Shewanella sp. MBTL60-007 TaxID=2815911 RepID=UPI001BC5ED64|nr:hypothetical protein [Shewanella sp. MBTL60-007]GIU20937.1 hypothetical protein TUM3792_21190 [Shewanella sp. MBTL60-007]